jgi:hypothetical protein
MIEATATREIDERRAGWVYEKDRQTSLLRADLGKAIRSYS